MTVAQRTLVGREGGCDLAALLARSGDEMIAVENEPTAETRKLLALMSTGVTDRAIARELGISERTVHRRIARLQALLGAQSRFQFGLHVAASKWL